MLELSVNTSPLLGMMVNVFSQRQFHGKDESKLDAGKPKQKMRAFPAGSGTTSTCTFILTMVIEQLHGGN